jgi:hypothetical protein
MMHQRRLKVAVYLKGELRLPEYGNVATAQVGAGPTGLFALRLMN